MTKPVLSSLLAVGLTLLLAACQSPSPVSTDYDTGADFSGFHRYSWLEQKSGADKSFDPLLATRVHDALAEALTAHGFQAVGKTTDADFLVRYFLKAADKTSQPKATGTLGVGSFGSNVGMGVSLRLPLGGNVVEQRAQIVVDFLDPHTQKLVWRGSRDVVLKGDNPKDLSAQIAAAVDQIVAAFPPR